MAFSPVPQPWEVIDLAISSAGRTARPGRIRRLANLYGYSVAYVSKWARPWQGDMATGETSCIDRFLRLLPALHEMCPQSLVLAIQLVEYTYEDIMNMSDSPAQTNLELARELLHTVNYLLDPQSSDTETGELARAKSIVDRALAARRNPKGSLGRLKLSPKEYTNLARASR